jgi:glycine cleavage system H protein
MRFSRTHEWVRVDGNIGTVGLSSHAKKELGDIVFIQLPKVEQQVDSGDVVCVIESTKAASDVHSPVSGIIDSVNQNFLSDQTWIYKLKLSDPQEVDCLLTKDEYEELVDG